MDPDNNHHRKFRYLVEELSNSGKPQLDERQMNMLKKICKESNFYIVELFKILLKKLKVNHAEVRLSAFQICNEIFLRSHCFRELVLKDFKNIAELTIGHNPKKPLPKPSSTASQLRKAAITAIHAWHEKFKEGYVVLTLGYNYLRDCYDIDFDDMVILTEQDRQRREDERLKQEEIISRRIQKVQEEMNELTPDILNTITEFNNAFKLLIPDLHNFFIPIDQEGTSDLAFNEANGTTTEDYEFGSDVMREHGINKETTIQVNLSNIHKVQRSSDNEVIILTLQEHISTISKIHLPKVRKWEQSVIKYSSSQADLVKKIVDLKTSLEVGLKRYASIDIVSQSNNTNPGKLKNIRLTSSMTGNSDSDDDDDFIDVPFDDPRVVRAAESEAALLLLDKVPLKEKLFKTGIASDDLQAAGSSSREYCSKPTNKVNSKSKLKKKEMDIDKLITDDWQQPPMFNRPITGLNQIWAANEALHEHDDDIFKRSDLLGIATRAVDYQREFEPVLWECRFPLPSGRLCPRKDRERCPIHGPVVPRNEIGTPLKPEDIVNDQQRQEKYEREHPAWQDPALLADIRASTGVDLDMKKVKKRKKKYPNLTDIKALENTPRKRLENKIFNKRALSRVSKALAKS